MSQIYTNSNNISPIVPSQFIADDGNSASPNANIIRILSSFIGQGPLDTVFNFDSGIRTEASGSTIDISLTNRLTGFETTPDEDFVDLFVINLGASPLVFYVWGIVIARRAFTGATGAAFSFSSAFRTDGTDVTLIGINREDQYVEPAFEGVDIGFTTVGRRFILGVAGVDGISINWNGEINWRQVS